MLRPYNKPPPEIPMIIITSKSEGFRRVGIAHAATPTEYPDDAFTPEQLAALQAEPMLTVVVATEVKEGDEGETTGDGTGEALPEITGEEIPGEEIPAAAEVKEGDEGETTGDGTGEALPEITGEEIPGEEIPAAAAEPKKKGKGK